LPFSMLLEEGFEADTYIDIFDGGPTVEARISTLRSIQENRRLRVNRSLPVAANLTSNDKIERASGPPQLPYMVATTSTEGFRATIAMAAVDGSELLLSPAIANALEVAHGESVRALLLGGGWGSAI
jgi:arginine N-succinyltransferase